YDALGRQVLRVLDAELESDESELADPAVAGSVVHRTSFDPGSRVVGEVTAAGNAATLRYDAAHRLLARADDTGDAIAMEYDRNSNVVLRRRLDAPSSAQAGAAVAYVESFVYDGLDRCVEAHELGRDGTSVDHVTRYAYDSRHNRRR